jgi:hypothetical protein
MTFLLRQTALAALLLVLAAPLALAVDAASATAEGDRIADVARLRMAQAEAMKPSRERNVELSDTVKLIKEALAAYLLAAEVSPEDSQAVMARMTDLRGMLFWCNKSFAIILPAANAPKPDPEPAPDQAPAPSPPAVLLPEALPPAPELPPPAALTQAEIQRVQALLDEARKLSIRIEEGQDTWLRYTARVKAAPARLDLLQKGFKRSKEPAIIRRDLAAWDAARDEIRREAHDYQEKALRKTLQIREWRDRMAWCFARVEHFGPRAFPVMEAFSSRPNFPLNEDLIDYLNGQFSTPFSRMVPAEGPPPGDAQATERLLHLMAEAAEDVQAHRADCVLQETKLSWMQTDLKDLDTYWAWRDTQVPEPDLKASVATRLRQGIERTEKALKALEAKGEALEAKTTSLHAALQALPRTQTLAVEAWRLRQAYLPEALGAELEAWMQEGVIRQSPADALPQPAIPVAPERSSP